MGRFTINLYSLSKKENSTMQPTGRGTEYNGLLLEGCSILQPRFRLSFPEPQNYNYMAVHIWNRYYFITNWVWDEGTLIAECTIDALASWKSNILQSSQYVLRSAAMHDGTIVDELYPTKNVKSLVNTKFPKKFTTNLTEGSFVVGIINGDGQGIGAVSYYIMSNSTFNEFKSKIFLNADWLNLDFGGVTSSNNNLIRSQFNPFQYVASIMWMPFTMETSSLSPVKLGYWDVGINAGINAIPTHAIPIEDVAIPSHPQSSSRGSYLNLSPYSRHVIYYPPFPSITLDTTVLSGGDGITGGIYIDAVTGVGNLEIYRSGGILYTRVSAQIGVPIQLGQIATDFTSNAITTGIAITGKSFKYAAAGLRAIKDKIMGTETSPGPAANSIINSYSNIGDAASAAMTSVSTSGSNGSISAYILTPTLVSEFINVVDNDPEHLGNPYCKKTTLSNLSGYVLCMDADLDIPCMQAEMDLIIAYLNGGFYIE